MSQAHELSASKARRLIGAKKLSPLELLDACIAQIERINPRVNAVTATDFEHARERAREAEAAVMKGKPLGPLHGLPLGIKDLNDAEGLPTTYGSPLFKDNVPGRDESVVARLKVAGAVVFCKTNVPEFGAGANTTNPVWGPTRNPFDSARIAGGSSGGAAAALACSMMPLASGSDSGGSLRIPAAFCGVVAHRGTPGLVPTEKHVHGYTTNGVQGPMARDVADTALMLSAMAAYQPRIDPLSYPVEPRSFAEPEPVDLTGLRVAVSADLGATEVDDGIRACFEDRVARFGSAFAVCEQAHPDFSGVRDCYWTLRSLLFLSRYKTLYETHGDDLGANVAMNYRAGLELSAEDIARATAEQTGIYRRTQAFFDDYDLLICPSVAVPPFPVEQHYCERINDKPLERYLDWLALTWITTTPGNPVSNLPCGRDHTGTPFGLQIIGPMRSDAWLLGVAKSLEELFASDAATARPLPDFDVLS